MKHNRFSVVLFCCLAFIAAGCQLGATPRSSTTPSSSSSITVVSSTGTASAQSIISSNCVTCHSGSNSPNLSILSTAQAYVTAGLIVPGSPGTSTLFTCLTNNGLVTPTGQAMPSGAALSGSEIQTLKDWIAGMTATTATPTPSPAPTPTPTPVPGATPAMLRFQAAQNILAPACFGCHSAGGTSPNLSGFTTEALWRSSGRVVAGSPSASSIYTDLKGSGGNPANMPTGNALTATQLTTIQAWITNIVP